MQARRVDGNERNSISAGGTPYRNINVQRMQISCPCDEVITETHRHFFVPGQLRGNDQSINACVVVLRGANLETKYNSTDDLLPPCKDIRHTIPTHTGPTLVCTGYEREHLVSSEKVNLTCSGSTITR
jgi:hypothetical protein